MASIVCAAYPTTGLQLHLDAGKLTGYGNGDVVTAWPDLAGGDNNATSSGTPTYIANALNGRPAIKIDGTSDRTGAELPKSYDFYAIPTVYNVKTIAFVFKPTSFTYWTWAPMMAGPTSDNYGWHGDTSWGTAYWDHSYSYNSIQNSDLAIDGVGGYNGGWTGVDYDNFHVITIQLATGTQFDMGFLAHTARYNDYNVYGMEIAELLLYTQQLTASELEQLQFELGFKYGLWSAKPLHPTDKATLVPVNDDLSWQAYNPSWGVNVYFDPNEQRVATGAAAAKVVSDQAVSTFDPGTLKFETTYYWRVDLNEPNTAGSGYILHKGPVWSFKTVPPAPKIKTQPLSQTVDAGSPVTLSVAGDNMDKFQWYRNGSVVNGATGATLQIASLGISDEGVYRCVATNSAGSDTSDPAVVVSKRLMGWWKLDGNLSDSVASAVPGALAHDGNISNPDFVASGKDGGAYEFKQDGRTIVIADSEDFFNFYPQGLTVSAWVKTTQTGWGGLVAKLDGDKSGFYLTHNGSWFVSGARTVTQLEYQSDAYDLWQLVTLTLDPKTQTLKQFVNGQLRGQAAFSGIPPINQVPLYFGAQSANGVDFPYAGLLDEVKIWSYPLDAVAVARLYTDLTPGSEVCLEHSVFDTTGPAGQPDCRVNIHDFAAMAEQWLDCNLVPTCIP